MARLEPWEVFEADVQQRLGLDATVCSGNKFYDSGDAVDNAADSPWPLWVDCKYTTQKSYSLKRGEVETMASRAQLLGKHFMLAVRFFDPRQPRLVADYALVPMDDYQELLDFKREGERAMSDGDWA